MGLLDKLFGSGASSARSPASLGTALEMRLHGDGRFHVAVVGEPRYVQSFERVFGPRTRDGIDQERDACIVLEDDNPFDDQTVRIDIDGLTVGYLSREHARTYTVPHSERERTAMRCRALVRGGWDRGVGDTGDFGVSLDLPADLIPVKRIRTTRSRKQRDEHGQPNERFNLSRRIDRSVHELLGLTKGIIADGAVTVEEAGILRAWMAANPEAAASWPGSVLADRIARIYEDGRADEVEREGLRCLLEELAGGSTDVSGNPSTRLPLDDRRQQAYIHAPAHTRELPAEDSYGCCHAPGAAMPRTSGHYDSP